MQNTWAKIAIAVTFSLCKYHEYEANIQQWCDSSVFVIALVSSDEAYSYPVLLNKLVEQTDSIHYYTRSSDCKGPSLRDLRDAFISIEDFDLLCYVNADIEIVSPVDGTILPPEVLVRLCKSTRIVFGQRVDYEGEKRLILGTYTVGYDFFAIPRRLLQEYLSILSLDRFYIGQVGWDYYLPLVLSPSRVAVLESLPIYHKIHPTGSTQSWESSIIGLTALVNRDWKHELPLTLRLSFDFCTLTSSIVIRNREKTCIIAAIGYLLARIDYYFCIAPILRRARRVAVRVTDSAEML